MFLTKKTKKTLELLRLLQKLGLFNCIKQSKKKSYKVYPLYTRSYRQVRHQFLYLRQGNPLKLSLQAIKTLNINTPCSSYILETNMGVTDHKTALRRHQGGVLKAMIF